MKADDFSHCRALAKALDHNLMTCEMPFDCSEKPCQAMSYTDCDLFAIDSGSIASSACIAITSVKDSIDGIPSKHEKQAKAIR